MSALNTFPQQYVHIHKQYLNIKNTCNKDTIMKIFDVNNEAIKLKNRRVVDTVKKAW